MSNNIEIKRKEGFTIIEVVLVLAIAGLIFLMVFLALPALQRAQRDTQRRDQLSMLMTQLTQYQANNRNRLPQCASSGASGTSTSCAVVAEFGNDGESTEFSNTSDANWKKFYENYLLAQDDDSFEDPLGQPYSLYITTCDANSGSECNRQRSSATFMTDDGFDGTFTDNQNYAILITYGATCDGETVVPNTGARRIAVTYKLEGGGTYCSNN